MPSSEHDPRPQPRLTSPLPGDVETLPAPDAVLLGTAVGRRAPQLSRAGAGAAVLVLDAVFVVLLLTVAGLLGGPLHASLAAVGALAASAVAGRSRSARLTAGDHLLEELPRLHHVASTTTLVVLAGSWLPDGAAPGPGAVVATWALVLTSCAAAQLAGSWLRRTAVEPERTLLIGSADRRERFRACLDVEPGARLQVVGDAGLDGLGRGDGGLPTIEELIARHRASRVVVLEDGDPARAAQAARRARNAGVRVSLAQDTLDAVGPPEHVEQLGGAVLLSLSPAAPAAGPMTGKRVLDVVVASLGALALAPLLAGIALAIRLTSPGPVLFWQDRVGLDGRRFRIAKFRTMVVDAEARKDALREHNEAGGGLFKITDDPRVTRVGRLLRRTSLDELPQLINVLRGEMSLVGPRPLVVDEDALIAGWHRDRLALKPGMTGRWQIMGSARIPMDEMVRLDQQYVASWSLWLDLRILLRTVLFVVRRRGL